MEDSFRSFNFVKKFERLFLNPELQNDWPPDFFGGIKPLVSQFKLAVRLSSHNRLKKDIAEEARLLLKLIHFVLNESHGSSERAEAVAKLRIVAIAEIKALLAPDAAAPGRRNLEVVKRVVVGCCQMTVQIISNGMRIVNRFFKAKARS